MHLHRCTASCIPEVSSISLLQRIHIIFGRRCFCFPSPFLSFPTPFVLVFSPPFFFLLFARSSAPSTSTVRVIPCVYYAHCANFLVNVDAQHEKRNKHEREENNLFIGKHSRRYLAISSSPLDVLCSFTNGRTFDKASHRSSAKRSPVRRHRARSGILTRKCDLTPFRKTYENDSRSTYNVTRTRIFCLQDTFGTHLVCDTIVIFWEKETPHTRN